jgi:hypothetical protein
MNRYITPVFTSNTPWSEQLRSTLRQMSLSMSRGDTKTVIILDATLVASGVAIGRSTQTLN